MRTDRLRIKDANGEKGHEDGEARLSFLEAVEVEAREVDPAAGEVAHPVTDPERGVGSERSAPGAAGIPCLGGLDESEVAGLEQVVALDAGVPSGSRESGRPVRHQFQMFNNQAIANGRRNVQRSRPGVMRTMCLYYLVCACAHPKPGESPKMPRVTIVAIG